MRSRPGPIARQLSRYLAMILLIGLGCALAACASPPAVQREEAPFELTVVHSNDTWGYLLPCG